MYKKSTTIEISSEKLHVHFDNCLKKKHTQLSSIHNLCPVSV